MSNEYLPRTDVGLRDWADNFCTQANLGPPTVFGLAQIQVDAMLALATGYSAKLAIATAPATRTSVTILEKDAAKAPLVVMSRQLSALVRSHLGITDAQLALLGLTVPKIPAPIAPPGEAPNIDLIGVKGRTVKLNLHPAGKKRGKPADVAGAAVYVFVGPSAPANPADWTMKTTVSNPRLSIDFGEDLAPGTTVWITARWYNPRTQEGPAAEAISCNLPGFGPGQTPVQTSEEGTPLRVAA